VKINPSEIGKNEGWGPNPKQEQFLQIPVSVKEGAYLGGAGSGKSDVLLYYALVHGWYRNPRFKQVFMRRTFPELRREIIPRSREIYQRFDATFNKSDMAWTFPAPGQAGGTGLSNNGAMIFMGHCENENDVHNYDSMEINLFTPDELTSFTEYIYTYIGFQRGRSSDPTLPAIIRSAGMPGGIGHGWVKKRFIDPYPAGGKIIQGRANVKRIYIHATQADNRFVDPNYKQSLEALPEAERNAKLYGSFDAYLGQVFDEFRDLHYADEPENAIHVVKKFDIPDFWPKFVIGDWGYAAMTYILYLAVSPTRRVYAYREDHWRKTKIEEWSPYVRYNIEKEQPKEVKFCRSAGQDRGQEHTIQQQISDALGCQIELSSSGPGTRVAGKQLLHEYLRWKEKKVPEKEKQVYNEMHAQWLYRNRGLAECDAYLRLFEPPKPELNLPKLQIFEDCPLLIGAIKQCVYAKANKDGVLAEDVAQFDGDDPYDTIRYGLDTVDRYFETTASDFTRMEEQSRMIEEVKKSQDWTSFYMRARTLEAKEKSASFGVRRYRH
jgi:hypothetical protein